MFTKKTLHDIDVSGKTVLLRADYNVPLDERGAIAGDYRIRQSLPTIRALLKENTKLVICSHLGRPEGKPNPKYSLKPVARRLSELLSQEVQLAPDCVGPAVRQRIDAMRPGEVLLLENVRFHPQEEANDDAFAAELAKNAEVFVQDCFGVVHRAHASIEAITKHLPSVAGLLLAKEVDTITTVMNDPKRPLMAIMGGAKISDKIDVLRRFIEIADVVAIGGAMANTFLAAQKVPVGNSKYDADDLQTAQEIMELAEKKAAHQPFTFYIPQDFVVAKSAERSAAVRLVDISAHTPAQVLSYPKQPVAESQQVASDEMILDIGPFSAAFIAGMTQLAGTVIWNGTLGMAEVPAVRGPVGPFAHGTEIIIEALAGDFGAKPYSVVGGGDTAGYLEKRDLISAFNLVSTGGGAGLELMAGRILPGVAALPDK